MTLDDHQAITNWVYGRLKETGRYDAVFKNAEYHTGYYDGEFDVLTTKNGVRHYYEVKSHDTPQALKKAKEQFRRAYFAFPSAEWKFIYVTPTRIKRCQV